MIAAELMLLISRAVQETIDSTATGGTVSTLIDTYLKQQAGYFDRGTLWITRGTPSTTVMKEITSFGDNTVTFSPAEATPTPGAIVSGNAYAIAAPKFDKKTMLQAINQALAARKYPVYDTSLTTVEGQEDYTLPAGVSDIRTVEIAQEASAPYGYVRNRKWREAGGLLIFIGGSISSGRLIRILYAGTPAAVTESSTMPYSLDIERLKWAAIENLWRRRVQMIENDSPIEKEMLNEAKANHETAKLLAKEPYLPPRDMIKGWA